MKINDAIWDGLEAENRTLEEKVAELEAELLTAKNAYDQLAGIHHRTNAEWKKDAIRARVAEAALAERDGMLDLLIEDDFGYAPGSIKADGLKDGYRARAKEDLK